MACPLATHHLGGREPHRVSYDDAVEAVVVSAAVDNSHPGLAGGPIPGSKATMVRS